MELSELPKDKKILLFDGVCNLCDASIQFVIKHDEKDTKIDSTVLYEPGKAYYYKSDAVFKILKELNGIYRLLLVFSVLPKRLLDYLYDYVAQNRYKWYGKKESCMVPTPELQSKFLA
jgi:predicted DCC family thiol-disulfide oxidoreductase YuxK